MIDLALLLQSEGIDPAQVLVMRHRPWEPGLRKAFLWLAAERPDLFNAYQQTHEPKTEAALMRARFAASFVGHEAGRAVFVGLYANEGHEPINQSEYMNAPDYQELLAFGLAPWDGTRQRQTSVRFHLREMSLLAEWKGRLVVEWPKPDRAWYRWGAPARNRFPVQALLAESLFAPRIPDWQHLVLQWRELQALPTGWRTALAQWRGIYYIMDAADGKGYVGSAYGADNLLGRWLNYAASGHGGNRLLIGRGPASFLFSILQRVSPDLPPEEVIALESSWKTRLHTRAPNGLNGN